MGGELLALSAATAAVPVELLEWGFASWLIVGAAIIGAAALSWYAFDLISVGESPLTNKSVKNIRAVIIAMKLEEEGVKVDWGDAAKKDAIRMVISNWTRLSESAMHDIDAGQSIKLAIGDTLVGTAQKT